MSFVLDLIVIAVFVISVVVGAKRGFFRSFMSLVSTFIAFVTAWYFTPTVSAWLGERFFDEKLTGIVYEKLKELLVKNDGGYNLEKLFSDSPEGLGKLLEAFDADKSFLTQEYSGLSAAGEEHISRLASKIAHPVSSVASNVCAFVGIFLAALLALFIIKLVIGMIVKLPVLRTLDTGLGILFGIVAGALLVVLICRVAPQAIRALGAVDPDIFNDSVIENSVVVKAITRLDISAVWHRIFPELYS